LSNKAPISPPEYIVNRCNKISAEGIKLFSSSAIRKLIHLKRLQIRFVSLRSPDDLVIKRISLDLKQLKHLQKLTVDLSGRSENLNQRPREILYDISQRVMNVTPCKGFYIDENQVGDKGLKYLTRSITNYHKGLKDLTLIFSFCNKITDQGAKSITAKLSQRLQNLQAFNISFGGSTFLTEEGLKEVIMNLKGIIERVQNFTVDFCSCENFTDEGLRVFADMITKPLDKLKYLAIDVSECQKISEEGVAQLGPVIAQYMNNLKTLVLNVDS